MIESLCDPYHDQLQRLSNDQFLVPLLHEIGEQRSWWHPDRTWIRMSGKFDPRQETYATLVFRTQDLPQDICLIEVSKISRERHTPEETSLCVDSVGWLRFTKFPHDLSLPLLSNVLNEGISARVIQYLPHHRCTIQFTQMENGSPGFAKVFDSDVGRRIHDDGMALWKVASLGELGFSIPRPGKWDEPTRTLWQGTVEGTPVKISRLFDSQGPDLAYKMGRAIGTLHTSRMTPRIMFDKEAVLKQAQRHGATLLHKEPQLHDTVEPLLHKLEEIHAKAKDKKPMPLHTDLHPEQWLEHETGLGLVDFDRIAFGDPEYDAAGFMTELEFKDKGRGEIATVTEAFTHGYESIAPPLDQQRLHTYRSHKWLAKALRAVGKIKIDGASRAQKCLVNAKKCLSVE